MGESEQELILVVNPGSTSTKLAIYRGDTLASVETVDHPAEERATRLKTMAKLDHRVSIIRDFLARNGVELDKLSCIVARGGLLRPVKSGAYGVNPAMVQDLENEVGGRHASNLGGLIAWALGGQGEIPAFIVDPVAVDEYSPEARVSGIPAIPRKSLLHALNMRACARRAARDLGSPLETLFLVIAHLGSGFSISPCYKGELRDANNSNEEGPFTVERAGTLPGLCLLDLACKFGDAAKLQMVLTTEAGMYGYTGTKDARKVEEAAKADPAASQVWRAMAYQVAKEICAMAATYPERPDAVVITGGLAKSPAFIDIIKEYTGFLGRHLAYPGEDEMEALAAGALRILRGEETPRTYPEGEAAR
jgi:butyrate kinase